MSGTALEDKRRKNKKENSRSIMKDFRVRTEMWHLYKCDVISRTNIAWHSILHYRVETEENKKAEPIWSNGYAGQRRNSKTAVNRHLGFYRTANSTIQSDDPENLNLETNMEWIGCIVCEIFAFKLHCDLETGVRGHSRSSKASALFDRAHTTLYSSSIVTMSLSITVSEL